MEISSFNVIKSMWSINVQSCTEFCQQILIDLLFFLFCFREDVEIMFAEKDRDNDGHLSFEEFTGQETKVEKAFK